MPKANMSMPLLVENTISPEHKVIDSERLINNDKKEKHCKVVENKTLTWANGTRLHDKKNFMLAKKMTANTDCIYGPNQFLKNNIMMTSNSKPTINEEGNIMKRSIVGSIEWFEKLAKLNNINSLSQSVKVKNTKNKEYMNSLNNTKKSTRIDYHGIEQIKKEQEREKQGIPKYETTTIRKKKKIQELKKQSVARMHRRGSRGYVVLNTNSTKETTLLNEDHTISYNDAQTASLYFHDTDQKKLERGSKITLDPNDVQYLENKMQNRENRTIIRKKLLESNLDMKHKMVDMKSKRYLETYKKRTREWNLHQKNTSKHLKRGPSRSLYSAIDNYREKREQRALAEKIAPMIEKYGENRLWEMNLRRKEQVEPRTFKHDLGNIYNKNWYYQVDIPQKDVEIIRRPKSSYTNYKNRDCDNVAKKQLLRVNNSNLQLWVNSKPRSSLHSRKSMGEIVPITDTENNFICGNSSTDDLIISGRNKLKSEIESISNPKNCNLNFYEDMCQLDTQFLETLEEEIIAIDYDKRMYL